MRYRDEKFYWTYQHGVHWPDDYIGPDSMTQWIIERSVGFTDVGLLRISESIRAYAYLILSSQASARPSIIGNMASSLTAQSAFSNNFENVVNRRVDIRGDIKCYQDTPVMHRVRLITALEKTSICLLPSDMELRIKTGTVGYNNKILISDGNFSLEKNDEVNSLETPAISHKDSNLPKQTADSETAVTHKDLERKPTITHKKRKLL